MKKFCVYKCINIAYNWYNTSWPFKPKSLMSVPPVKTFKLKGQTPRFCLQTMPACSRSTPGRAALTWWNGITNPRPNPALSSGSAVATATVISLTLRASAGNPASWTKPQPRCETKHGYKPKSNRFYLLKPASGALTKTLTGANTGPYLSNLSQKRLHRKRKHSQTNGLNNVNLDFKSCNWSRVAAISQIKLKPLPQ